MMYEEYDYEEVGCGFEGCVGCPYAEVCEEQEVFWGCAVWEEAMGDDL